MSIFNGKLTPRSGVAGRVEDKTPKLRVNFTPDGSEPRGQIKPLGGFRGIMTGAGRTFTAAARPLAVLYRFLTSRSTFTVEHEAKANAAPTVAAGADNDLTAGTTATATAAPVEGARAAQPERVRIVARAVAYGRAAAVYIRGIAQRLNAGAVAVAGSVAKYRRDIRVERTAAATQAQAALAESRENKVPTAKVVVGGCAGTVIGTTAMGAEAELAAAGSMAATVAGAADLMQPGAKLTARGSWWFLPEQTGDTLALFQAFSGIQDGTVVEIDLETESAYWANAFVKDGTLALAFAETATPNNTTLEVS